MERTADIGLDHVPPAGIAWTPRSEAGSVRAVFGVGGEDRVPQLLGLGLADAVTQAVQARAPMIAEQLRSHDRRLAAEQAIDLAQVIPQPLPEDWWTSPLGMAMLRTREACDTVTQSEAARILGITRQGVADLVRRGKLTTSTGAVVLGSILERLAD